MPRDQPVADVMTTDVLSFRPDDNVEAAMRQLVEADIDGAPVLEGGRLVGMLSTSDLIVSESRLHFPTVISILTAVIEWPPSSKKFDEDLRKALGGEVREVMTPDPVRVKASSTIEEAATLMHDHDISRLPVVDDIDELVGLVSRADVLRVLLADLDRGH